MGSLIVIIEIIMKPLIPWRVGRNSHIIDSIFLIKNFTRKMYLRRLPNHSPDLLDGVLLDTFGGMWLQQDCDFHEYLQNPQIIAQSKIITPFLWVDLLNVSYLPDKIISFWLAQILY